MPKNIPSLKPRELIRLLEAAGCRFYREGKGDHRLYVRYLEDKKLVVPIDMGLTELSPVYCFTHTQAIQVYRRGNRGNAKVIITKQVFLRDGQIVGEDVPAPAPGSTYHLAPRT